MNPLEKAIKERGLKKMWVAGQVGISRAAMANLIKGSTPNLITALKLARLLNVTVEELWGYLVKEES